MYNLHGPDTLYSTRYGHILQCTCCNRVQITFRDHTLLVDEDELKVLVQTVKHARRKVKENEEQDHWTLHAGTDAGSVAIKLPEPSLHALSGLLEGAWSMYVLQERVRAVANDGMGAPTDVLHDHAPGAN